jgi:DNA-binding NtrC family response regulator
MKPRVLLVEDERAIQLALTGLLKRSYDVKVTSSGDEAIEALSQESFDLVLTDLALGSGKSGMDVLAAAGTVPVIMITAHGSEKVAVEAMKAGAADYVPKPFDNDEIRLVVERVLERTRLEREHRLLLERVQREQGLGALVGAGAAMQKIFATIHKIAETDLTVLVRGESGTGKELVAQAIHDRSARARRPLVAVNCAAMSRELVESELFGHERGSFTGADARRIGRFEAANGGTIFLDEIGDMPAETQAKVLRVLQERALERVGSNTTIRVDTRVIAATHRDLEAEVAAGRFREDLYYRLRVVEIVLPPLRERVEDIPAISTKLLADVAQRLGRKPIALSPAAIAALSAHRFPGNVRELRNVLERAAVLASGPSIEPEDLGLVESVIPEAQAARSFAEAKRAAATEFERNYLMAALQRHGGNVSRTAEAIRMVRQSLQQKMRELGLRTKD